MGLKKYDYIQIGNFAHDKYGRLYAYKIFSKSENKTIILFKAENQAKLINVSPRKVIKAFMNEWIKINLKKLSV